MNDKLRNIKILPPCLIGKGNYDIEIKNNFMFGMPNDGKLGENTKWSIVFDSKDFTFIDLVSLKKVMELKGHYPKLKKNEVMTLTSLALYKDTNEICVSGDIIKIKSVSKGRRKG